MRHILLVLSLAALMAASALPAFAAGWDSATGCKEGDSLRGVQFDDPVDKNQDLAACVTSDGRLYDNRLEEKTQSGGGWDPATGCKEGDSLRGVQPGDPADRNRDLAVCMDSEGRTYDNRLEEKTQSGNGWDSATGCREGDSLRGVQPGDPVDKNGDLAVCLNSEGSPYDNRLKTLR